MVKNVAQKKREPAKKNYNILHKVAVLTIQLVMILLVLPTLFQQMEPANNDSNNRVISGIVAKRVVTFTKKCLKS